MITLTDVCPRDLKVGDVVEGLTLGYVGKCDFRNIVTVSGLNSEGKPKRLQLRLMQGVTVERPE